MNVFDHLAVAGNGRHLVCRSSARWVRHYSRRLGALACVLVGCVAIYWQGAIGVECGRSSRAQMSRVGSGVDGGGGADSNGYTRMLTIPVCICADGERRWC